MSDGTGIGTRQITSFVLDQPFPDERTSESFRWVEGKMIFVARENPLGPFSLWRSDGRPAGTRRIQEDEEAARLAFYFPDLLQVGQRVFFGALEDPGSKRAWISDGTAEGTMSMESLCGEGCSGELLGEVALNGEVFFMIEKHSCPR